MKTRLLKLGALMFYCLIFNSCTNNETEPVKKDIDYLIVEKLILDYLKENPEWKKNEIIQQKACDSLAQQLIPLIEDDLYWDLPFKFEAVQEYSENGEKGYLALFNFDNDKFEDDRIANGFLLSVYGIIDESMINQLESGKSYYIKGDFLEFKSKFFMMTPRSYEEDKIVGDILLPNIRMKIEEIIPISK